MDRRRLYQRTLTFGPEDCCHAKWRSEPIPPVINPCCNYDPKKMLFVDRHLARGWTMGDRVLDNFYSPSDPSCMYPSIDRYAFAGVFAPARTTTSNTNRALHLVKMRRSVDRDRSRLACRSSHSGGAPCSASCEFWRRGRSCSRYASRNARWKTPRQQCCRRRECQQAPAAGRARNPNRPSPRRWRWRRR